MRFTIFTIFLSILTINGNAQPSSTPASGFEWVKVGSGSYSSLSMLTNPTSPSDITFGVVDTDPMDCTNYCSGNCDGDGILEKLVFGSTSLPASSCEQRAVNVNHWNNPFPDSGVANGATSGTVRLPTSGQIDIENAGTRVGGDENKAWIIGGNGTGNFSEFNTNVDYVLNWHIDEYSFSGGTGPLNYNYVWNWGEPGGGMEVETSGWNNYTTDGFLTNGSDVFTISATDVLENGGSFEVVFEANSTISISRNYGNADGKVQHQPGLEGAVSYEVFFDVWEIQAIMPVDLTFFDGRYLGKEIVLNWETASEQNSDRFEVMHSVDGKSWTYIGEVRSQGNLNAKTKYSFIDGNPQMQNYYKLKQIDLDGAVDFSNEIYIESIYQNTISVFPNPTDNLIWINGILEANYELYSPNGKLIVKGKVMDNISLAKLEPGVYYLHILNPESNVLHIKRIVKI